MKKVWLCIFPLLFVFQDSMAQPKYEFRGAWIATVDNIDWPSRGNYNPTSQKEEFVKLLNMHKRNGLNAVIVQVRPASDAFFPSQYEPWSQWLTGVQGAPPTPFYDPLKFMIDETHKRGMEFHAWCNPYRAEFNIGVSSVSPTHITKLNPEWFIVYGNKRYFDPGNKQAQKHVTEVIRDMVRRYDIDAIHFDDYFYPYRIAGKQFPDDSSYARYHNGLNREDWRRSNVDSVILLLSRAIRQESKYCKFGVSPFGVWRNSDKDPEGSVTKGGQTNYDDLYADILLWLRNGWIDYVTPQLYWEFGHKLVAYETLVDWWSKHAYGRQLYIGHGIYRAVDQTNPWRNPDELPHQIRKAREYPSIQGSVYYNTSTFRRNPLGWNDSLQNHYYKYPAIIPPMAWIDSTKPEKPVYEKVSTGFWKISAEKNATARSIMLYGFKNGSNDKNDVRNIIRAYAFIEREIIIDMRGADLTGVSLSITAINQTNNESELLTLQ